jgi:hypothetical protein
VKFAGFRAATQVAVSHQISEEIEHPGFERDQFGPAAQFASFGIEHAIAQPENDPCPLARLGRALLKDFLRTS